MKRIRVTRSVIPNLFTSLNMFSGFVSIVYAHQERFIDAAIFIIIGSVFDALDGMMARLTRSSSEFGVELDSLSDLVTFGVAPAFLIYQTHLNEIGTIGIVLSSLLMVFGGLRLARFNVQLTGFDKSYFSGLPIPSSAITIASFVILYHTESGFREPYSYFVIPLVIILSLLMVSKIRYETLPKFSKKGITEKPLAFAFVLLSIIAIIVTKGAAIFYVFIFMILIGILRQVIMYFIPNKKKVK